MFSRATSEEARNFSGGTARPVADPIQACASLLDILRLLASEWASASALDGGWTSGNARIPISKQGHQLTSMALPITGKGNASMKMEPGWPVPLP